MTVGRFYGKSLQGFGCDDVVYQSEKSCNISLTPGLFVITNPNHDDVNDTIWISIFRTQFVFLTKIGDR
ncbi:MAG: carbohydrate porin [Trichodesmium sp. St18_bin1]|nr:carbohydrate porin [Trichodesmium sp. St18_bin1]MDE5119415.1 carbohydrate porin [Trichodesmium sp. St19_bin1]